MNKSPDSEIDILKEIKELKQGFEALKYGRTRRQNLTCWGCGDSGHLRRNCPKIHEREINSNSQQEN